jgi:hypothetical protein
MENFKNHLFERTDNNKSTKSLKIFTCNRCNVRVCANYDETLIWHHIFPYNIIFFNSYGLPPLICEEYIIKNIIE